VILYHGSHSAIPAPNLSFARETTDFGKGFYTTTIQTQAEKWSERFRRRHSLAVVSVYEINENEILENISVLDFKTYSTEWLDYIISCRQGGSAGNYDLVIGGIANDDVFNTLTIYLKGYIDKAEAIKRLRYEKPNIQYCFKTQHVIDEYLLFKESITL